MEFVEIESRLGEECRLRNAWQTPCQVTEMNPVEPGAIHPEVDLLACDILTFATVAGKRYRIIPHGKSEPVSRTIKPEPANGPVSCSYKLPSRVTVGSSIGRGRNEPARNLAPFVTGNCRMRLEQQRLEEQIAAASIDADTDHHG